MGSNKGALEAKLLSDSEYKILGDNGTLNSALDVSQAYSKKLTAKDIAKTTWRILGVVVVATAMILFMFGWFPPSHWLVQKVYKTHAIKGLPVRILKTKGMLSEIVQHEFVHHEYGQHRTEVMSADEMCHALFPRSGKQHFLQDKGKVISLYTVDKTEFDFTWQASWPLRKDGDNQTAFAFESTTLGCVTSGDRDRDGMPTIMPKFGKLHYRGHVSIMFPKKSFLFKSTKNENTWVDNLIHEVYPEAPIHHKPEDEEEYEHDQLMEKGGVTKLPEDEMDFEPTKDLVHDFATRTHPRRWVLWGPFIDTSFLRNPLSFHLYRSLGGWASYSEHLSLNMNGVELGLYVLTEKIDEQSLGVRKATRHRMAGKKKFPYYEALIKYDWPVDDGKHFSFPLPNSNNTVVMQYPQVPGYLAGNPTKMEQAFVTESQKAMINIDNIVAHGTAEQLEEVLDIDSFIRFYLLEEVAKDLDGYGLSAFTRLQMGHTPDNYPNATVYTKLVHAAPWDFHLGYGFACMPMYFQNYLTGESDVGVRGWNAENLRTNAMWTDEWGHPNGAINNFGRNLRQFYLNLWQQHSFRTRFRSAWLAARGYYNATTFKESGNTNELMNHLVATTPMKWSIVNGWLEDQGEAIDARATHDLKLWANTSRAAFFSICHPENNRNFTNAFTNLQDWVHRRMNWMDGRVAAEVSEFGGSDLDIAAAKLAKKTSEEASLKLSVFETEPFTASPFQQ